jgi:hypothetical protein
MDDDSDRYSGASYSSSRSRATDTTSHYGVISLPGESTPAATAGYLTSGLGGSVGNSETETYSAMPTMENSKDTIRVKEHDTD